MNEIISMTYAEFEAHIYGMLGLPVPVREGMRRFDSGKRVEVRPAASIEPPQNSRGTSGSRGRDEAGSSKE